MATQAESATARRDNQPPASASTTNAMSGGSGMSQAMSASQRGGGVDVHAAGVFAQAEHQRQADGNLGGRHRQDEDEHGHAVGLTVAGAGGDEGEGGGVDHQLQRNEHEQDVATGEQAAERD